MLFKNYYTNYLFNNKKGKENYEDFKNEYKRMELEKT